MAIPYIRSGRVVPILREGIPKDHTWAPRIAKFLGGVLMNIVVYDIGVDAPITPDVALPALPNIPKGAVVVVSGRAPIWRYGMAFHLLHGSPAAAIATFDPRLGGVIVASHHPDHKVGTVFDVDPV